MQLQFPNFATRLTSDLGDRMAMLRDVAGQVALKKRDLADLLVSIAPEKPCAHR